MIPRSLWCVAFVVLALGCGRTELGLAGDWDGFVTDAGLDGVAPDARPDVAPDATPPPPDGATDVPLPPDGTIDVPPPPPDGMTDLPPPPPDGRPDGGRDDRSDRWDGGGSDGGGTDGGGSDGGGCDPATCELMCSMSGSGTGTCFGDSCVCGVGPDGGTTDGGTTDGGPPPPPDGGGDGTYPDFGRDGMGDGDREARDGMREGRDGMRDWGAVDATTDPGVACDGAACFEDCRAAGFTAGYCDPSGLCTCF